MSEFIDSIEAFFQKLIALVTGVANEAAPIVAEVEPIAATIVKIIDPAATVPITVIQALPGLIATAQALGTAVTGQEKLAGMMAGAEVIAKTTAAVSTGGQAATWDNISGKVAAISSALVDNANAVKPVAATVQPGPETGKPADEQ